MATKESKDTPELSDAAGIDSGASEVSSQPDAVPEAKKLRPLMKEEEISSNNPRGNIAKNEVGDSGLAPTTSVSIDEPAAEMDSKSKSEIKIIPLSAVADHKASSESHPDCSSASTSIDAGGSLVTAEGSKLVDPANDDNLPCAYKYKRFFYHLYQRDSYVLDCSAYDLVQNLIAAVNENTPTTLTTFHDVFKDQSKLDKPEGVLIELFNNLKDFMYFVKETYLELRAILKFSVEHFMDMLKKEELSATIMDSYLLTKESASLCETECDNESMEAETNDLLTLANSLRDDYIIERNYELHKSLYLPALSAATWMKAALKLANPSTERKACLLVLHRHALKTLVQNCGAAFTLKSQTDPVAFYFETFSNPEVSVEVESSLDSLQGCLNNLPKTSYFCACCHANREHREKTTLMEIACVPEYMVDILRKKDFKFIERLL
ncbi:hypothetical protein EB796_023805 [Bugula neritina]|uniref:Uncharacterized protein n=1 Tax=Bugula neritina TaxID=10212 RepID=A0A7J7IWV8_BUGNE|nr:hypothetical protein EB796_023805 [Bugula neritina]